VPGNAFSPLSDKTRTRDAFAGHGAVREVQPESRLPLAEDRGVHAAISRFHDPADLGVIAAVPQGRDGEEGCTCD
jgi:hypothetical protein